MQNRNPWVGVLFIDHIRAARNVAVDQAIRTQHLGEADPFADEEESEAPVYKKGRKDLIDALPKFILADIPPWGDLPQHTMCFAVPQRSNARLTFEMTEANVAYWPQAVHYNIEDESKTGYTKHYAPFEDCPDVFFDKKRARLFTRFKSANGKKTE